MLGLVFDTPLLIIGPVLVVIMGFLATVGLLVMRRRVLPRLRITAEDVEFINTMVQSVMMFYALTVALIAVAVVGELFRRLEQRLARGYRACCALP